MKNSKLLVGALLSIPLCFKSPLFHKPAPPNIKLTWKRSHLEVVSLAAVFSITALRDDAKISSDGREYTSSSCTLCGCPSQTLNDCDDWFATFHAASSCATSVNCTIPIRFQVRVHITFLSFLFEEVSIAVEKFESAFASFNLTVRI